MVMFASQEETWWKEELRHGANTVQTGEQTTRLGNIENCFGLLLRALFAIIAGNACHDKLVQKHSSVPADNRHECGTWTMKMFAEVDEVKAHSGQRREEFQ